MVAHFLFEFNAGHAAGGNLSFGLPATSINVSSGTIHKPEVLQTSSAGPELSNIDHHDLITDLV
jgi:hypothetical protein